MFTFHSTQFNMKGFVMVLSASLLSGLRWTLAQLVTQKNKLGKGRNERQDGKGKGEGAGEKNKVGRGEGENEKDKVGGGLEKKQGGGRGKKQGTGNNKMGKVPEGEKIQMDCYTNA